jgi:hypothetical protein
MRVTPDTKIGDVLNHPQVRIPASCRVDVSCSSNRYRQSPIKVPPTRRQEATAKPAVNASRVVGSRA